MNLLDHAKAEFLRSNADRRHPFRFFVLSTFGPYPEARWVVKRDGTSDFKVLLYTDSRSPKVAQLQENNRVTALFYHPKKKLQIRLKGEAILLTEGPEYQRHLQQVQQTAASKDYSTKQPPGMPLNPDQTLLFDTALHFAAVWIQPNTLDVLELGHEQHRRCAFQLDNGRWQSEPLVP